MNNYIGNSNQFDNNNIQINPNQLDQINTNLLQNSLNGTNLDDINYPNNYQTNNILNNENSSLIKSVAKEIINGLKDNNISLYENSSIGSRNDYDDEEDDKDSSQPKKSKYKIKETIEDFIINNETTKSLSEKINGNDKDSNYIGWFFDECFNYKDFLILFIIYFILSQEMIKDVFSKYFTSLNPDYEGKVGIQGVIIYGLLLTILYMILRKIF